MKLSAITALFTAAIVPFAAVSATVFKCSVRTSFEAKNKKDNPAVPGKPILDWVATDLQQTFIDSYRSNDMNMVSDVFNKFSMKREVTDETEDDGDIVLSTNGRTEGYLDALAAKLRGTTEVGRRSSWYAWYYYWYYSRSSITCNYVSSLDDALCLLSCLSSHL